MMPDIEQRLASDFALEQRSEAVAVLQLLESGLGDDASPRILRCVLFLAGGDLTKLTYYADRALADCRDVMYWAEYDRDDRQVHDFHNPFSGSQ